VVSSVVSTRTLVVSFLTCTCLVRAYVYAVFRLLLIYKLRVSLLRVAKALLDKEALFKLAYLKDFGPYY
jgi:hypothetical protein